MLPAAPQPAASSQPAEEEEPAGRLGSVTRSRAAEGSTAPPLLNRPRLRTRRGQRRGGELLCRSRFTSATFSFAVRTGVTPTRHLQRQAESGGSTRGARCGIPRGSSAASTAGMQLCR